MVKNIRFKDLSSGMQSLLGISILLLFVFVIFSFSFHIRMENRLGKGFENVARWECYNESYLTHELDFTNRTFYMIEPIHIMVEENFNGDTYFWNDNFYRLEIKEDCRVV